MSVYEDYAAKAASYDQTRVAVGVEIVLGCLTQSTAALPDQRVLDIGCGTGNYVAAVSPHVGEIVGIDAQPAMLDVAAGKLRMQTDAGEVTLEQGDAAALPYGDASFDAVLLIQILHHLDDSASTGWSGHRGAIAEAARVVRPGGVVVIGSSSRAQLRDGYWYYSLISRAADALAARYAPLDQLRAALAETGLRFGGQFTPVHETIMGAAYFDGTGPLSEEWRAGESTWALATPDELEWATSTIETLEEAGELENFVRIKDQQRSEIGQVTFLYGTRST